MTTFKELGLNHDLMASLDELGFTEPSPIQEKAIPFILESKKDLIALAQTGTGKTAAYALPILNQIKNRELSAIILCPTRELCLQISEDIKRFAKHSKEIDVTAVYGGERIDLQIRSLRRGTNIVVGTPGRVNDLIRRKVLNLSAIRWLVLDEADEMLDMGFKEDLNTILAETPKDRQTLLFSATMSKSVFTITKQYMKAAEEISIGEKNVGTENVSHEYYVVQARDRFEALKRILDYLPGVYGILFCRTRRETQEIADKLKQANYDAEPIHGEISQTIRTKIMHNFKNKQIRLLVATDVAARGIDVSNLSHVINYNLPDHDESYTHRTGRTGRAQNSGIAISIVTSREVSKIKKLEKMIGRTFELKQVPNGEDIFQKQIDTFLEEIENTDDKEIGHEKYFKEIIEKLEKIKKEDLIKYFVVSKFGKLAEEHQNNRDLNSKASKLERLEGDANHVSLKLNLGKRHRLDVRGLFDLINSHHTLKGIEIGKIDLLPEYTIFAVDQKYVDDVIKTLNGKNIRGIRLRVSRTESRIIYEDRRRDDHRSSDRDFKRGPRGKVGPSRLKKEYRKKRRD